MRKLMTALSFAVFALAFIGAGTARGNARAADVKFDFPATAKPGDVDLRLIAGGKDDYPPSDGDGDDPDIRFPGDPRT
jgi:hypothetical protein